MWTHTEDAQNGKVRLFISFVVLDPVLDLDDLSRLQVSLPS